MKEIVNKFLLTGEKFMPKYIKEYQDLLKAFVGHLINIVKGFKNSVEQVIQTISIRKNKVTLFLLMVQNVLIVKIR